MSRIAQLPPPRRRLASIMLREGDVISPTARPDTSEPGGECRTEPQHSAEAITSASRPQPARQGSLVYYPPMNEEQVRFKMGKMTRDELEFAIIHLSQDYRPSMESVTHVLNGFELVTEYQTTTKRVETFIDHIDRFNRHCIPTGILTIEQEDVESMERVIADVQRDVEVSLEEDEFEEYEGLQVWCNGMLALLDMADTYIHCGLAIEITTILHSIEEAIMCFTPMSLDIPMTPAQSVQLREIRLQMRSLQQEPEMRGIASFKEVEGQLDGIFGYEVTDCLISSIGTSDLTVANVSKLPRDINLREQPKELNNSSSSENCFPRHRPFRHVSDQSLAKQGTPSDPADRAESHKPASRSSKSWSEDEELSNPGVAHKFFVRFPNCKLRV